MTAEEQYIEEWMKESFSHRLCNDIYHLLSLQFPNIKSLEVDMDEKGMVSVRFEKTEYSYEQVHGFLDKFKKDNKLI